MSTQKKRSKKVSATRKKVANVKTNMKKGSKRPTRKKSASTKRKTTVTKKKTPTKKTATKRGGPQSTRTKSGVNTRRAGVPRMRTRKPRGRALICVDGAYCFWTTDGRVLSNLIELRDALAEMSERVYRYHVGGGKNDFADWVEQVLDDRALAGALRQSRKPSTARAFVVRRLAVYDL